MSRELMQQVLEALEAVYMPYHPVVIALRERLAQPEPGTWREVTYDQLMEEVRNRGYEIRDAKITALRQARSLTDELMDCVDRLGSEADTVDPRVWDHLLVYAPKHEKEPVAWADAIIDDLQGLFDTDGITEQDSGDALIRLSDAIAAVEDEKKRYTAPSKQEPVAWRTFDGEGGYDYRSYEMNETYDKEWSERNPNHKGWVEPLYTAPPKQWVGLTDEEVSYCRYAATFCDELDTAYMAELIEKDLKEKNHG